MTQLLKAFRREYKVSIADLSLRTGLPMRYIMRIEEDPTGAIKEHLELLYAVIETPFTAEDVLGTLNKYE